MGERADGSAAGAMRSSTAAFIGAAWLAAAAALGAAGVVARLRPPVPQLVLAGLTAGLLAAGSACPPLRRWALALDPRAVVALHLTRFFAGSYFLVLCGRGEMPEAFAVPAGWGDIAVACLALVLLAAVNPRARAGRRFYLAWNVLGLIDILGVVGNAAAQAMRDPESMRELLRMPLSLLPTFLVPLIIASHVLLFFTLRRKPGLESATPAT